MTSIEGFNSRVTIVESISRHKDGMQEISYNGFSTTFTPKDERLKRNDSTPETKGVDSRNTI